MSERSYRIRTDVTKDKVVRLKVEQDYDFLEILSLKIKQEDTYKLHVSDYGVIVGRVLANDSFGIPNAKVSVFIALDDIDKANSEITNIYPYTSFQTKDSDGRRYNLLPDESNDDCYRVVGTFPNKRLVLDNDTQLEIFDKYWKYTTVTNKSGDYMIFGVPTGGQQIHVDIDLSDIGILSQKPIDFIYKGYNSTQFENAQQFKEGNNLDNLTQLLSQNQSVHVYPFWGDSNLEEIAISRCDIQVQYKFEPTCVFFGAIMTDNYNNNIGHKCSASKYAGFNRHLVTGEGTIEMIRKTPDNLVEEFQIQGNRLIDGDGVWCYQIPMNLDFVGTDEFGNIVPTDDPNKGIPTRTCVRFRVSMQETGNEGVSRHRAKYLIPNVQELVSENTTAIVSKPFIESGKKFEQCYEFGSATPDEYYRDLYWNKVYSVKNYIPRIQTNAKKTTQNYSAIRTVNSNNDVNPVPYNHARFRLAFAYRVLCMIMTIVFAIICGINALISGIAGLKILWVRPFGWICSLVGCIGVEGGLTEDEDSNIEYYPCCSYNKCMSCKERGCTKETSYDALINVVQQALSQEYDTVNLDFYNDWLNGSLYMPLWFWKKTKKKKFLFGLFSKKAVNSYCSCNKNFPKLRVTQNCSLAYDGNNYEYSGDDKGKKYHEVFPKEKTFTIFGVIKEFVNKAGLNIYYYAPGIPNDPKYKELDEKTSYVRLYSTDIILLGSLNSCDLDNYPNVFTNLPTTTANVPFIATIKQSLTEEEGATYMEGTTEEEGLIEVTGMDWLHKPEKHKPRYGAGLFMDLACNAVYTKPKSCVNVERLCELGVTLDTHMEDTVAKNGQLTTNIILADGMITRYELVDNETRAMFASLNNNGFTEKIYNPNTGYFTYKLRYLYPTDFDGHMKQAYEYTSMMDIPTYDNSDDSYNEFRFGPRYNKGEQSTSNLKKFFYSKENGNSWSFPIFNNSFYFYFGIHEGSTAIDKFNSRFYATCYKNEKYPFTLTIETHPAKWCKYDGIECNKPDMTRFATINITLNGIKIPYSYTLYNEFNEEILQEDGIYTTELNFGYKIKEGGGEYVYTTKTVDEVEIQELVKNGIFSKFSTGEEVKDSNGNPIYVENGTYKIEVTDTNGNKLTQNIIIEQVPISIVYTTIELGDKYYNETISKAQDFCNQNEFFGEIRISKVTIDGTDYNVFQLPSVIGDGEFNLVVKNDEGDTEEVHILITPQQEDENSEITFTNCSCNGVGGFGVARLITDEESGEQVIQLPIWRPGTFTITVTQKCCGDLNDNVSTVMAVVKNGQTFNAYIDEMPLKFILGKNEQINTYNPKFNKSNATSPREISGWFGVHDEKSYVFSSTTMTYENIWSDFVTITTEQNPEETITKYYLTEESIYNILSYKFEKMFNLSKNVYVCGDQDNKLTLSHTGGKAPIMYRGHYPVYNEMSSEHRPDNQMTLKLFNSEGTVTLSTAYPNIVGHNYTYIDEERDMPTFLTESKEPIFNTLYSDYKFLGNYFAAFTRNGGVKVEITTDGEEECKKDSRIKYQQIPYLANSTPNIDGEDMICPDVEYEYDGNFATSVYKGSGSNKPYFRGEFIDRRLDYKFVIFTPYAGDDSPMISSSDMSYNDIDNEESNFVEPIWKKGRISGQTFNGIEMAYNKDYEIIGYYLKRDGNNIDINKSYLLEYYYGLDTKDLTINDIIGVGNNNMLMMVTGYTNYQDNNVVTYHNKDVKFKRFYKTILKCGNKKNDINDFYWAGEGIARRNPSDFDIPVVELCDKNNLPAKLFSYNHISDTNMYNGDFSVTNYPLKRLLDVGNIDSCDKLTFTCSSCSYEVDVDVADVGSNEVNNITNEESGSVTYVTGTTQECGETEFIVDCRNMINPVDSSMEECAANKSYNVLYENDGNTFYSKRMTIKCKIKNDAYNTTHSSYSYFPTLFGVKRRGVDENSILTVKHCSNSISEMEQNLKQYNLAEFSYDKDTVKDIKRASKKIAFLTLQGKYWVNSNDDKKIAYDDNTNVKNVIYSVNKIRLDNKLNLDWDVLGVYLKRNYINNNGDNLTKKISTIQITTIYDVRKFDFELNCAGLYKYSDTTTDVNYEQPTVTGGVSADFDGEGNMNGVSSTIGTGEPTSATSENNSGQTETQRTIYRIKTYIGSNKSELINWNQQFYSVDVDGNYSTEALSAIFAIESKFTSDVSISNTIDGDYLCIDFDVYWSGDLAGRTLEEEKDDNPTCYFYIKMPNKLIYQLKFRLNDFPPLSTDCDVDTLPEEPPVEEPPTEEPEEIPTVRGIYIANNQPGIAKISIGNRNYELNNRESQTFTTSFTSNATVTITYDPGTWSAQTSSWCAIGFVGDFLTVVDDWGNNTDRLVQEDGYWIKAASEGSCSGSIGTAHGDYYITINVVYNGNY